jgi:hypothetical protein
MMWQQGPLWVGRRRSVIAPLVTGPLLQQHTPSTQHYRAHLNSLEDLCDVTHNVWSNSSRLGVEYPHILWFDLWLRWLLLRRSHSDVLHRHFPSHAVTNHEVRMRSASAPTSHRFLQIEESVS